MRTGKRWGYPGGVLGPALLTVCLVWASPGRAAEEPAVSLQSVLLQQARGLLEAGAYEKSAMLYMAVLQREPGQPAAEAGLREVRARQARGRTDLPVRRALARVRQHYSRGELAAAIQLLNEALNANPLEPRLQRWLNRCRHQRFRQRLAAARRRQEDELEKRLLEVAEAAVPYLEPRRITPPGTGAVSVREIDERRDTPAVQRFRAELAETYVSLDFKNADLREVVRYLAEVSDINLVLDELALLPEPSAPAVSEDGPEAGAGAAQGAPVAGPELDDGGSSAAAGEAPRRPTGPPGSVRIGTTPEGMPRYQAPPLPPLCPRVTVYLRQVPLLKALDVILRTKGLDYELDTDFIWISTRDRLAQERMVTRVYTIKHAVGTFHSFRASPLDTSLLRQNADQVSAVERLFSPAGEAGEGEWGQAMAGLESAAQQKSEAEVAEDLVSTLLGVVPQPPGASITLYQRTGKLIVRNTPRHLRLLEGVLESLDVSSLQVSLEVRILEVASFAGLDVGIEYSQAEFAAGGDKVATVSAMAQQLGFGRSVTSSPTDGLNLSYVKLAPDEMSVILRALTVRNLATLLSSPRLTCLNNQTANIRISTNSNYIRATRTVTTTTDGVQDRSVTQQIGEIPEGIVLEITPNVSADHRTIRLTVHPSVVELVKMDRVESGDTITQLPTITQRTMDTTVSIETGATLAMGGLMRSSRVDQDRGIPGLSRLPLLGGLFRTNNEYDDKRNLIIFITARILDARGNEVRHQPQDLEGRIAPAPLGVAREAGP